MEEKLEQLRRSVEELREAPVFVKASKAEAALDHALELLEEMVKEFRRV